MGSIAARQEQYTTYVLTDPASHSSLEVVPERGGIITRWQVHGRDILYLDSARFADPTLSVRGGIPILFPICGNLPDNTYTWNGQSYTLKQHGFARDLPWQVIDQDADRPSITLGLSSSSQTLAVYPFDFDLAFTYSLDRDSLRLHQRYNNRSAVAMPFSAGFHPYFQVADKSQLEFSIPAQQFQDQRTKAIGSFTGTFDFSQDEIDTAFIGVDSQVATVVDPAQQTRLTLEYSDAFSTLVFWTINGKDYYCLEPWTAPRNALNSGDRLLYLDPGASLELDFSLKLEFIDR